MKITRPAVAALLVAVTGAPALAQPIEIATLGRAPLIGQSTSPTELRYNVRTHEATVRQAAYDLGLTTAQYQEFRTQLDAHPNWVTIPRHLDAMTWAADGQVHVLHDVIIPANQKGVEVDLHSGDKLISLFLPAKCGNLSVIRRNVPHVAATHIRNFPVPHVAAAAITAPAPVVAAVPPAAVVAPAPAPVPIVAPVSHAALGFLPVLGLLPFLFHGGGGSSVVNTFAGNNAGSGGGTISGPPPCPPGTDP